MRQTQGQAYLCSSSAPWRVRTCLYFKSCMLGTPSEPPGTVGPTLTLHHVSPSGGSCPWSNCQHPSRGEGVGGWEWGTGPDHQGNNRLLPMVLLSSLCCYSIQESPCSDFETMKAGKWLSSSSACTPKPSEQQEPGGFHLEQNF